MFSCFCCKLYIGVKPRITMANLRDCSVVLADLKYPNHEYHLDFMKAVVPTHVCGFNIRRKRMKIMKKKMIYVRPGRVELTSRLR